jgi:DNA polymerase-3 subunit gamma/tau
VPESAEETIAAKNDAAAEDLFGASNADPEAAEQSLPEPEVQEAAAQSSDDDRDEGAALHPVALGALRTDTWPTEFERFQFSGILHNIALNLELTEVAGSTLRFSVSDRDATLLNERHPAQLAQALQLQLGEPVSAEIIVAEHGGCTPASHRAARAAAQLADAERAISSDDALRTLMEAFDGQIIPGSIRPNLADGEPEGHGADAEERV